jgi:hypothetical protein
MGGSWFYDIIIDIGHLLIKIKYSRFLLSSTAALTTHRIPATGSAATLHSETPASTEFSLLSSPKPSGLVHVSTRPAAPTASP